MVPVAPGPLAVGDVLPLRLTVRGRQGVARPRLVAVEAERALAWRGGVSGLFVAEHGFRLSASGRGCTVVHHESFSGLLAPLVLSLLGPDHGARYAEVNVRLAERVAAAG